MFKKLLILTLISNIICETAFARAGGRSSFGSSGRSSTSHFNQGSRGSRTYEGGSSNGRNYAPMQKTTRQEAPKNNQSATNSQQNQQPQQPNQASSFFQRNPMLSTIGAVLAGSWLGHMIFGNGGFGGHGAENAAGGGGFMMNFLIMVICAFVAVKLFKYFARRQVPHFEPAPYNAAVTRSVNTSLPESEKQNFADLLAAVQNAWSEQDSEKLKKLTTPEMAKYFSDSLSQNISQNIANKVENVEVTAVDIAESWQEEGMDYATVILEWSSLDYMVNLNGDYIIEGSNENLVITSEAWTFTRYSENGKWILSAIAQIE